MSENRPESFEAELKRLKPAAAPEDFMSRLALIVPPLPADKKSRSGPVSSAPTWWQLLRWLTPVTAGVALVVATRMGWPSKPVSETNVATQSVASEAAVKPDAVQIDRQLVTAYDAVAELPGGEPVRFRCQEWMDAVVLRDSASGLLIEQRTPRFEVVAARLDTF